MGHGFCLTWFWGTTRHVRVGFAVERPAFKASRFVNLLLRKGKGMMEA